jgi:hypothetical protein
LLNRTERDELLAEAEKVLTKVKKVLRLKDGKAGVAEIVQVLEIAVGEAARLVDEVLPTNLSALTVVQLQAHLRSRKMPVSGSKALLIERLAGLDEDTVGNAFNELNVIVRALKIGNARNWMDLGEGALEKCCEALRALPSAADFELTLQRFDAAEIGLQNAGNLDEEEVAEAEAEAEALASGSTPDEAVEIADAAGEKVRKHGEYLRANYAKFFGLDVNDVFDIIVDDAAMPDGNYDAIEGVVPAVGVEAEEEE